ncbi:uncharacterized protein [Watersipora subatra]|uniref:uncharacterized protein isoform X1 n=1 Tax=Watersipora subatra TaxID=2589382 RepID=UPI00355BAA00
MAMNSSTECLVPYTPSEKIRYAGKRLVVQNKSNERAQKKRYQQHTTQYACLMFIGILLLGMMFCLTGIFGFYISHLQEHVGRLEKRIQALERIALEEDIDNLEFEERFKREAGSNDDDDADDDVIEESRHHRISHHGIASHNIAMVYGDPKKIRTEFDAKEADERQFRVSDDAFEAAKCGTLYERTDKQMWCTTKRNATRRELPKYRTSRYNHMYFYFEKASWMNRTKSIENFNLTYDGRIEVKHDGIYIVHASIHFTDVTNRDHPHYGVYKTDSLGNNQQLVSKCMITQGERQTPDDSGVYPCQAWQMIHLKEGEQVFMSIGGYSWFLVEKETFHLALIKLNDYSL